MWTGRPDHSLVAASRNDVSPWPAALIVWRLDAEYRPRSQYSAQVILPFRDSLRVRLQRRGMWTRCAALFAAPRTRLAIDSGGPLVMGFVDPDSEVTVALDLPHGPTVAAIPEAVVERWRRALGDLETLDSYRLDAWVRSELVNPSHQRSIHPGVRRVVHYLRRHELERRVTSLACLAQVAQMSPSRLMHVFTESLGIPLRPYVAWLRVQQASAALVSGHTVTEAAHIAGFADAPHLSRTVRRTVGVTPRQLIAPPNKPEERHVPDPRPKFLYLH